MKIAFRFDANNKIGMGHAVRCSALAEALIGQGCECVFFCQKNTTTKNFAAEMGITYIPVPIHELSWMQKKLTQYDAVIIDSYNLPDEYIDSLNCLGLTVICIDDNALRKYNCDAVINGNLHATELSYNIGRKNTKMLLGGQYTLLRREFRDAVPIEVCENAKRIFICFGGTDLQNFTQKAIMILQKLRGVELAVVLGAATTCDNEVFDVAGNNVCIVKNPTLISEVMRSCDISVIACGSMVYELAALGIPSVVTVHADNQEFIAGFLEKNRLMRNAGNVETITDMSLYKEVEDLLFDTNRRKRESLALKNAVSRCGAENASTEIIKIIVGNKKD